MYRRLFRLAIKSSSLQQIDEDLRLDFETRKTYFTFFDIKLFWVKPGWKVQLKLIQRIVEIEEASSSKNISDIYKFI